MKMFFFSAILIHWFAHVVDLVARGVGYHHAGLDVHDRKAIEEIFLEGQLMVLGTEISKLYATPLV